MTDFVKRIVIKARFTSDDVDFVSMQRGWILQHHQKAEAGASIDIWVTSDRRTEIHQVDDRHIGTRYFTLRGPGSREVAEHIRQDCELWSISEALGELERVRARGREADLHLCGSTRRRRRRRRADHAVVPGPRTRP
ncbi:hypothetical protein TPA0909_05970 [Streptomyces albus]|nr:hypothetical protein TPA0909_05970 [Streptomyces albus]